MRLWQEVIPSKLKEDIVHWEDELNRCYNFIICDDDGMSISVDLNDEEIYVSENSDNLLGGNF